MKTQFQQFVLKTVIIVLVVSALTAILRESILENWITSNWYYIIIFFGLFNIVLYKLFDNSRKKDMSKFTNFFMITTFLKLLLYLLIILLYIILNKQDAVPFTLTFFAYYLIFTTFEVISISQQTKNNS